jgi:hypothetical protein
LSLIRVLLYRKSRRGRDDGGETRSETVAGDLPLLPLQV